MAELVKLADFTEEQKTQHSAVLEVAGFNLGTLTDQIQTLDNPLYDEILECLDSAKEALEQKQAVLKKVRNT